MIRIQPIKSVAVGNLVCVFQSICADQCFNAFTIQCGQMGDGGDAMVDLALCGDWDVLWNWGIKMRLAFGNTERDAHPVDLIEQIAYGHDWTFERTAEDEISVCVEGRWADYHIAFSWMEDHEALHLACAFDLSVAQNRYAEMHRLLLAINEKLLMGHFDFWQTSGSVIYRQALLLAGGLHPSDAQVETLLINALEICESHYCAFQMVAWSGAPARQALQYALFETIGSA